MTFLRLISQPDIQPVIAGEGISLRRPRLADHGEWAALREQSRAFLTPWEPVWHADDLTLKAFRRRLRRYEQDIQGDRTYSFFIFRDEDARLVGGCTLSNVQRGVQQSCNLGYWTGANFAGQGYMTRAVKAVIPYVFGELKLHRLQAACVPDNERSKALLRRCGFREEGYARGMININAVWRDHLVFAILRDDRRPA